MLLAQEQGQCDNPQPTKFSAYAGPHFPSLSTVELEDDTFPESHVSLQRFDRDSCALLIDVEKPFSYV